MKISTPDIYDLFTELGPPLFIETVLIIRFKVSDASMEMNSDGKASRYRNEI